MSLCDFMYVGNKKLQQELLKWIKQSFDAPSVQYCVLEGKTGNGKTSLVHHTASMLDIPVYTLYPEDVQTKEDINSFLQGINLSTIDGRNHKIVLVEDINDFRKSANAYQIHKYTRYPVVYTTTNSFTLEKNFVRNSLHIKLKKPNPRTLMPLMLDQVKKYNLDISEDELIGISKRSPSVRSALITILSDNIRISENTRNNYYFDLMSVKNKFLKNDFNYFFNKYCFDHIYDFSEESLDARKHFSYIDYHICYENFNNKSIMIPKEIINYYPSSFDSIQLKKIKISKEKRNEVKKDSIKLEEKKQKSLSDFFNF